jgi:hypothetical protein
MSIYVASQAKRKQAAERGTNMGIYFDLPELKVWRHVIMLNHTEESAAAPASDVAARRSNSVQETPPHSAVRDEKKLRRAFRGLEAALNLAPVTEVELDAIATERALKTAVEAPRQSSATAVGVDKAAPTARSVEEIFEDMGGAGRIRLDRNAVKGWCERTIEGRFALRSFNFYTKIYLEQEVDLFRVKLLFPGSRLSTSRDEILYHIIALLESIDTANDSYTLQIDDSAVKPMLR